MFEVFAEGFGGDVEGEGGLKVGYGAGPDASLIGDELRDRFGRPPDTVEALLELSRVRVLAQAKGVEKLSLEQRRLTLEIGRKFSLSEQALPALTALTRGNFRFTQSAIVIHLPPTTQARNGTLGVVREVLTAL